MKTHADMNRHPVDGTSAVKLRQPQGTGGKDAQKGGKLRNIVPMPRSVKHKKRPQSWPGRPVFCFHQGILFLIILDMDTD